MPRTSSLLDFQIKGDEISILRQWEGIRGIGKILYAHNKWVMSTDTPKLSKHLYLQGSKRTGDDKTIPSNNNTWKLFDTLHNTYVTQRGIVEYVQIGPRFFIRALKRTQLGNKILLNILTDPSGFSEDKDCFNICILPSAGRLQKLLTTFESWDL